MIVNNEILSKNKSNSYYLIETISSFILIIKSVDIFGNEFNFRAKDQISFKTFLGSVLSLFCIAFFIFGTCFMIKVLINTKNPISTISNEPLDHHPFLDLEKNGHVPGIGILTKSENRLDIVPAEKVTEYITPKVYVREYDTFKMLDQRNFLGIKKETKLDFVKCLSIKDSPILGEVYKESRTLNLMSAGSVCPKLIDRSIWNVEGSISEQVFKTIDLVIYPCSIDLATCSSRLPLLLKSTIMSGFLSKVVDLSKK